MRRLMILVIVICLLMPIGLMRAADLSVYVTCVSEIAEDGAMTVWFGYDSSETLDNGGFGYIGNPSFGGELVAGSFPMFAEFLVPSGAAALLWADGFSQGEYVYAEAVFSPPHYRARH